MRLTVIGAGPAYSDDPRSIGACYLVRHGNRGIVLDLGQGAFAGLASRVAPERLDAVLVSHLHPDHFVDLVPLRHWLRYHVRPPARARVVGPAGLAGRLDALHAQPGFSEESLDVAELAAGVLDVGPFRVQAARVAHTEESYGFRVAVHASAPGLVYSGDVARAHDLRPLIHPGDALLVEVSFGAGPVVDGASHLDGPAIAMLAAATRPGRVLLTHLLPGNDPAETVASVRAGYAGPVDLVEPGFETDI